MSEERECLACEKKYADDKCLRQHHARSKICQMWINMLSKEDKRDDGLAKLVERVQIFYNKEDLEKIEENKEKPSCPACHKTFSCIGNVNKHIKTTLICRKWIKLNDIKNVLEEDEEVITERNLPFAYKARYPSCSKELILNKEIREDLNSKKQAKVKSFKEVVKKDGEIEPNVIPITDKSLNFTVMKGAITDYCGYSYYDRFEPCEDKLIHVIWNVFLIDKQTKVTPDVIEQNKVGYILAILPVATDYPIYMKDVLDVPHDIMEYGYSHTPDVNIEQYRQYGKKIDEVAKGKRRNVFIFCNNGYQRSLAFIVYYLITFHPDEVPNIEKALDLILPQIDKSSYYDQKKKWMKVLPNLNLFST